MLRWLEVKHTEEVRLETWWKRLYSVKNWPDRTLKISPWEKEALSHVGGPVQSQVGNMGDPMFKRNALIFSLRASIFKDHSSFKILLVDSPPTHLPSQVLIEFHTGVWANRILHQPGWVETISSTGRVFCLLAVSLPKSDWQEGLVQL